MLTRKEAVRVWGKSNLRTVSERALADLAIPDRSKQFLRKVGLPLQTSLQISFDFDPDDIPTLRDYLIARGIPRRRGINHLRRIGTDYGTELCLDEKDNGALLGLCVEDCDRIKDCFVNSSIEQFAECFAIFLRYCEKGAAEEEQKDVVARLKAEQEQVDARAFDNVENWWSVIIEQLADGLL